MNTTDIDYFKQKLLAQKKELEQELAEISRRDPNTPGGYDATSGPIETDSADDNELADKFEELEDNAGIVTNLENELKEVKAALDRIDGGTYGIDEKTGEPIQRARLDANPSARTDISS